MKDSAENPLGKQTQYDQGYDPTLLFPISRTDSRSVFMEKGGSVLPFAGYDFWNAYEVSWLNRKGKPEVAVAQFRFEIETSFIIESKSFKLYLNSLNQECFESIEALKKVIVNDLSVCASSPVHLDLIPVSKYTPTCFSNPVGYCLDQLDIFVDQYQTDPTILTTEQNEANSDVLQGNESQISETLFSHLLRSNCPITGQPDWGTIQISYQGEKIDHASLLRYIISYRVHSGYHEQITEQIFTDLISRCRPSQLTVQTWFVRRGGLDINCLRSTEKLAPFSELLPSLSRQ